MAKNESFLNFLTDDGRLIYEELKEHVSRIGIFDVDSFGLAILANSFDLYSQNGKFCKENGTTHEMETKTGTYPMLRPEYTVMKNEYQNIMKHSTKYGITPADREKIFSKLKDKPKKNPKDGLDDEQPMKIAQ